MLHWVRLFLSVSLPFLLGGCPAPSGTDDAGSLEDAGPGADDAGPDEDAGTAHDAGPARDEDAGPLPDPASGAWSDSYGLPGALGFGARVSTLLKASDGTVYAGGIFTHIGGVAARNVARYDGQSFFPLGEGLPIWVKSLALDDDGTLYAGGALLEEGADGNYLMRFDGVSWERVGDELAGDINAIAILEDGALLIGGSLGQFSATQSGGLAVLEGESYASWGGASLDGQVNVILEDAALGVCVGGLFASVGEVPASNVACHRDGTWTELGGGLNGEVNAFLRDSNGDLIVGGGFAFFETATPWVAEVGLARLDGDTLIAHAGGVHDGSITSVRSLSLLPSGSVLVGGCFAGVGEGDAALFSPHAALLHPDASWSQPDAQGGLSNSVGIFVVGIEGAHASVVLDDGAVLVGGLFTDAGDSLGSNLALLEDAGFATVAPPGKEFLGVSGLVNEMAAAADGALYVGGYFSWAGTTRAQNIARLSGGAYQALGGGLDGTVHALVALPDGGVIAGGDFWSEVNGDEIPFLARFSGGAWSQLVEAPDGPVLALALDDDGSLLVGGDFTTIGGTNAARIARIRNGSVEKLGAGLDARVTDILIDTDGSVVATGLFKGTAQNPLLGVARFDGTSWSTIGGGIDDDDYGSSLALYEGEIVLGGPFESVGGVAASGLARFDGVSWSPLGAGLASSYGLTLVSDIAVYGTLLFATGIFDSAGGEPARHLAAFDGQDWWPLGGGLNDLGESLVVTQHQVMVGGPFVAVDGEVPSIGIGRFAFGAP